MADPYTKRAADSIALDVPVGTEKLGDAFPTAGSAVASPAGLVIGTGTPLSNAVRFTVSGGTSGVTYSGTATITLSDTRTVVELFEVDVSDDTLNADPTIVIDQFPPANYFTNLDSARDLLGDYGIRLRLDDDRSGALSPRERKAVNRGAGVASNKVKMYCQAYADSDLPQSMMVWHYSTVLFSRWLCLREGNPQPAGIWELYNDTLSDLKELKMGTMQLPDIMIQLDPEPSFSNVRLDPVYAEKQLRVQKRISDDSFTRFKRFRDTFDNFTPEADW